MEFKKCPWYNKDINILSLILPHHKNFKKIKDCSLSQFGFEQSDNINYSNVKHIYDKHETEKIIKCYSYKIEPNEFQKQKLYQWFELCNSFYNYCVIQFNLNPKEFNLNYMKQKLIIFNKFYGKNKKPIPYDILTDVIKQFCTNVKTCFINYKKGNIKHFKINYKIKPKQFSILLAKTCIHKNGFYIRSLSKMKGFEKIPTEKITHDSRLIYKNGEYFLRCPMDITTKTQNKNNIVALDPGERNFMTFYSPENAGFIGTNTRELILKIKTKINIIDRAISRKINRGKKKLNNVNKLKKIKQKYHNKIKHIVKELHNQTSLYLVKNYSKILIPKFETQNMVKCYGKRYITKIHNDFKDNPTKLKSLMKVVNKKRRLSKNQKFVLNSLSHYSFRQNLQFKCKEYNCELQVVTEEYTSKCCSFCGLLSDNYVNREKFCVYCGHKCDRDINGSKNILLKNSKKNIKPFLYKSRTLSVPSILAL